MPQYKHHSFHTPPIRRPAFFGAYIAASPLTMADSAKKLGVLAVERKNDDDLMNRYKWVDGFAERGAGSMCFVG
jgi:hypothetical protein